LRPFEKKSFVFQPDGDINILFNFMMDWTWLILLIGFMVNRVR